MLLPSRQQIISLIILLLAASPRISTATPATTEPTTQVSQDQTPNVDLDSARNINLLQLLNRHLREVHFSSNALSDVIDDLRDRSGANMYVDWPALEKAGISRNATVTMRLKDVSLASTLDLLLNSTKNQVDLTYTVEHGAIIISTVASARDHLLVETYILPEAKNRQSDIDSLEETIESTIDPPSWRDNGGSAGSVRGYDGRLVVTANALNQKAVGLLILELQTPPKAP
jgi:hypothetical protein